jgi:hypothetical protein
MLMTQKKEEKPFSVDDIPASFKQAYDITNVIKVRYRKKDDTYIIYLDDGEKIKWKDFPVEEQKTQLPDRVVMFIQFEMARNNYENLTSICRAFNKDIKDFLRALLTDSVGKMLSEPLLDQHIRRILLSLIDHNQNNVPK